jgi:hypothetical protein
MHLSPSLLSSIAAFVLLILGAYSGTLDVLRVPLRAMHLGIAALFGLSVPLAVYAHCKRFFVYGAGDAVAWLHFVMLAALLHLAVRIYAAWGGGRDHVHSAVREPFEQLKTRFRGKQYDVSSFVDGHPGGELNLRKATGSDLETVWQTNGVAWHMDNATVMHKLKEFEVG